METDSPRRNVAYDILRAIAIACIAIAHTDASGMLHQLRNFDVPLLLTVAGSVFVESYARSRRPYCRYVVSRIVRLVAPTWAFLVIFFLSSAALFRIAGKTWPFSPSTVVASVTLINGIGYLWVIRVFALVAIAAPLLASLDRRVRSDLLYYGILAGAFAVYQIAHVLYPASGGRLEEISIGLGLYYLVPYGCFFGMGIRMRSASRRQMAFMSIIFLALFAALLVRLHVVDGFIKPTQAFKYPPELPYVTYAGSVSCLLYAAFSSYRPRGTRFERLLTFVGSSSLWIYLWHIYAIYVLNWVGESMGYDHLFSGMQGVIVLAPAVAATFIQKRLVSRVCEHPRLGASTKKILAILFLK